jgi:hypothetical protein
MGTSRFIKTPKLSIVLQVTDHVGSESDGRAWIVHDIERNRGFRVVLPAALGVGASPGTIDGAMGLAIERALVTPPEKVAGPLYDVAIAGADFVEFTSLAGKKG